MPTAGDHSPSGPAGAGAPVGAPLGTHTCPQLVFRCCSAPSAHRHITSYVSLRPDLPGRSQRAPSVCPSCRPREPALEGVPSPSARTAPGVLGSASSGVPGITRLRQSREWLAEACFSRKVSMNKQRRVRDNLQSLDVFFQSESVPEQHYFPAQRSELPPAWGPGPARRSFTERPRPRGRQEAWG